MRCPTTHLKRRSSSTESTTSEAAVVEKQKQNKTRQQSEDKTPTLAAKPLRPALAPLRPFTPCDGTDLTDSELSSPNMSRRSSTSSSSVTGKCVHFHCNPLKIASYHFTHSRDAYDRSPIIPSNEDLDIPSCKSKEEKGWIKCLQRKAREAAIEGQPPPFSAPYLAQLPKAGEGSSSDEAESVTSGSISPNASEVPSLIHDSDHSVYSSCSESEEAAIPESLKTSGHARSTSLEMFVAMNTEVEEERRLQFSRDGNVSDDCPDEDEDDSTFNRDVETEDEEEEAGHHRRKLGMCSLGKFSRASLYSEDDCFGGF